MIERLNNLTNEIAGKLAVDQQAATAVLVFSGLLALFAGAIGLHVYFAGRERRFSLRRMLSFGISSIWAVPVIAVLAVFAARATGSLRPERPRPPSPGEFESTVAVSEEAPGDVPDDAPGWVRDHKSASRMPPPPGTPGRNTFVLSTNFVPVKKDAEEALRNETVRRIRESFGPQDPLDLDESWTVPMEVVLRHAVKDTYVEQRERTVTVTRKEGAEEKHPYPVYRVHWKVEISPEVRATVGGSVVKQRAWVFGGLLAMLTLILGATAVYLRLDAHSQGRYRFRLKAATVALIVAGGLAITALLPLA